MTTLLAALHYLALGIGFAGLWLRLSGLKEAKAGSSLQKIFFGDNLWGLAALLWIGTGLARAFLGFEKGTPYYLQNTFFWIKMGLFFAVFLLELQPMITLLRWRLQKKTQVQKEDLAKLQKMIRLSQAELALIMVIPFVASAMARGRWL